MNQSKLDKIIGMDTIKKYQNQVRDSDGDKLMNIIDCKPYNKNKQGIIHEIGQRMKEGGTALKQSWAANRQIREKARAAGYREREKQSVRVAEEKEKIMADKKISGYKSGNSGFFSQLVKQTTQATAPPKAKVTYRKVKGKKGKYKRVAYVQQQAAPAPRQPMQPRQPIRTDFTSGNVFIK